MIIATPTFPQDEMLDWFFVNAVGAVQLQVNPNGWGGPPTAFSAYNAPEFLHEKLANKHFRDVKEPAVVCYWIHGGHLKVTLTFHEKVYPQNFPMIASVFEVQKPFKSVKGTWPLRNSPFLLLEGIPDQ